jgi:hypothetical protein
MSIVSAPFGFRPVKMTGGQPYNGAVQHMPIASAYATAIYTGDLVKLATTGYVQVDTGTTACTPYGVFLGCRYTDSALGFVTRSYWPASQVAADAYAFVATDPDLILEVQADAPITFANVGENIAVATYAAGSTANGISAVKVGASTLNTTNTLPFRVVGIVPAPDNSSGDLFTRIYVRYNAGHQLNNTTGLA